MRSGTFWLRYRTPSGSGKYIEFGLRIETGAERTTIIVDIFHIHNRASTRHRYSSESRSRENGGSHEEVRGKRVELGPSLTSCQGYDAQILLIRRLNLRAMVPC